MTDVDSKTETPPADTTMQFGSSTRHASIRLARTAARSSLFTPASISALPNPIIQAAICRFLPPMYT